MKRIFLFATALLTVGTLNAQWSFKTVNNG
jgi:hypothetical protein